MAARRITLARWLELTVIAKGRGCLLKTRGIGGERRAIALCKDLQKFFKVVRQELICLYEQKHFCGNLIQRARFRVEMLADGALGNLLEVVVGQDVESSELPFIEGVKRDLTHLFEMVDKVMAVIRGEEEEEGGEVGEDEGEGVGEESFMKAFEFFSRADYRDLNSINDESSLAEKVFFVLSHPIFFDYEDYYNFIEKLYQCMTRNRQYNKMFLNMMRTELESPDTSLVNWTSSFNPLEETDFFHDTLCYKSTSKFGGHSGYVIPGSVNPVYEQDCAGIILFLGRAMHHRKRDGMVVPIKPVLKNLLFKLVQINAFPKLHLVVMRVWCEEDHLAKECFGKKLVEVLSQFPNGLPYCFGIPRRISRYN